MATAAPIQGITDILIAEIENRTGDALFDGTIRHALLLHLAQSPHLEIVTDRKVISVLRYMGKSGAEVKSDDAIKVCRRTGTKAAVTGSIVASGDEFTIDIRVLGAESGSIVATEQVRAQGKSAILKALEGAAFGLRRQLGESPESIERFSRPFAEMATASLEALSVYTMGRVQWLTAGEAAARPYYERAVDLDPEFASAWSALGYLFYNMGLLEEAIAHTTRAYQLRERATERERVRLVAAYHSMVTGDFFKSIDAYREWDETYPRDGTAAANIGDLLAQIGHWDKALALVQRGHAIENTPVTANNVIVAAMAVGRHDDARAILEDSFARGLEAFYLHLDAYQEAFLRGDASTMKRHFDAVAGRPAEEDYLIAAQADTEAYYGRFALARELSRRAVESARDADAMEMAAMWEAESALREAEIGNKAAARAGATAALALSSGRYVRCLAALVLARSGQSGEALGLADKLDREYPQHTIVQRNWLPCIRAAHAMTMTDWKAAVQALDTAQAVELGLTVPFEGGLMIAPYLRGVALIGGGRGDEAAVEFMKIVARPGLIKNFVLFPLAHLQAAKALAMAGRKDEAASMQAKFDELWKSADLDVLRAVS